MIKKILILVGILLFILALSFSIMYNMFYTLKPNVPAQKAIGELTGLKCDKTEVVYYRITTGFLGKEKWIKTTKDKADIEQEECIK